MIIKNINTFSKLSNEIHLKILDHEVEILQYLSQLLGILYVFQDAVIIFFYFPNTSMAIFHHNCNYTSLFLPTDALHSELPL